MLTGAWYFLSEHLANHPMIRRDLREKYKALVTISTYPTEKGNRQIDIYNPLYKVKRLNNIPFQKFNDELWIEIQKTEKKELIKIVYNEEEFVKSSI